MNEDTYRGDPNDPLSLNLYTYTFNNPLSYYDLTGHWPDWLDDAVDYVSDAWDYVSDYTDYTDYTDYGSNSDSGSVQTPEQAENIIDSVKILAEILQRA